jgi:hypothetical protein
MLMSGGVAEVNTDHDLNLWANQDGRITVRSISISRAAVANGSS